MPSFPYTTTSPPPTAGPLPVIERANLNTPYAAGGGGGGGGGPVLNVSTINFNPLLSAGNPSQQNMRNAGSGGSAGFNGAVLAFDKDPVPNTTVWMGYNTINDAIQITQSSGAGFASAALEVDAILCSTINGAVPGGGVGPNPAFSTVTAETSLSVTNQNTPGQQLRIEGVGASSIHMVCVPGVQTGLLINQASGTVSVVNADLFVSSINGAAPGGGGAPPAVVSTISSLVNVSTINSGSPGILTVAGSVVVTDYLGASQISTPSIVSIVPGGAVSVQNLTTSSITSAAPIINMTAPVGVSSLSVSSINGTSYPPAGTSLQFSTLFSGNSTINCDPLVTTALINFNTTVGHVYQIQTQMMIQGNGGQDGTENDDVVQDVVNQVFLNTTQGSFISTANAAARDVNIGTCGMWKATQGVQALGIQGTFSTQVNLKSVVLLDFGAI